LEDKVKFICTTEFIHSGGRAYFAGTVYPDITVADAEKLIAVDKKKPLGALSFFTPIDEEAVRFLKTVKRNGGAIEADKPPLAGTVGDGEIPKAPTRADLIAEAKSRGIKGADRMTADELKAVISAQTAESPQQAIEPPAGVTVPLSP
jgi:hypothetical protein